MQGKTAGIPSQIPGLIAAVHAVRPPVGGPLARDAPPVASGERRRATENQCVRSRGVPQKKEVLYANITRYSLSFGGCIKFTST